MPVIIGYDEFMLSLKYAYLIGDMLLLFPAWTFFYWRRKDLRQEMLGFGALMGILTFILEYNYFSRDYWSPQFIFGTYAGIEDFLFGFFGFGIAATVYEELYGKVFAKRLNRKHNWKLITVLLLGGLITLFHVLTLTFKINSIYSLIFVSYACGILMLLYRHDLVRDTLISAIFFGVFYFFVFLAFDHLFPTLVAELYKLENLSGKYLAGFPIEETLWGSSYGFMMGPLYEFYKGLRFEKEKPA